MRLETDGKSIDDPTKGDLMLALPKADMPEEWSLALERNEDDSLEAESRPAGGFGVTHFERDSIEIGDAVLDAAKLRELFVLYFEGGSDWKKEIRWKKWEREVPKSGVGNSGGRWNVVARVAPLLITAAIVGWIFLGGSIPVPGLDEIAERIPVPAFLESTPAKLVAGFGLVVFLFFLFALTVALIDARKMRRWVAVSGRITRSEPGFELRRSSASDLPNNVRVARITYEYSYMGASRLGNRVSADKIIPPEQADRMLRDYPVGKIVTVYCDPKNPSQAIIERDPPPQLALGCSVATLIGIAVISAVIWLVNLGPERLTEAFPNTVLPVFIPSVLAGLMFLAAFVALLRQRQRFDRFQTTTGTVVKTFVNEFKRQRERRSKGPHGRGRDYDILFMPVVEYRYSVAGVEHLSRSIRLSGETSGSKAYAENVTARYPSGGSVTVFYDPEQPNASALQKPSNWFWMLLVPVPILLWLAWRFSGLA